MLTPKTILSAVVISATYLTEVSSFTITPTVHSTKPKEKVRYNDNHQKLKATILAFDDEDVFFSSTSRNDTIQSSQSSSPFESITNKLSQDMMDEVTRLAVAFATPEQDIELEDIYHINIIKITNEHIEICLVVCVEDEYRTLLVPISFRNDCSCCGSDKELTNECVLRNIFQLDIEAKQVLRRRTLKNSIYK